MKKKDNFLKFLENRDITELPLPLLLLHPFFLSHPCPFSFFAVCLSLLDPKAGTVLLSHLVKLSLLTWCLSHKKNEMCLWTSKLSNYHRITSRYSNVLVLILGHFQILSTLSSVVSSEYGMCILIVYWLGEWMTWFG